MTGNFHATAFEEIDARIAALSDWRGDGGPRSIPRH
jgi:hypothetical protein